MTINKVAIIGAGAMGTGIGQVAAANGCEVIFFDVIPETLHHSQQSLSFTMESLIVKNKISAEDAEALLKRCSWTSVMNDISDADMIVEAIVEDILIKRSILSDVGSFVKEDCIVTSNTQYTLWRKIVWGTNKFLLRRRCPCPSGIRTKVIG